MEAKKRVAASSGRRIGAFGCSGRLFVTDWPMGEQLILSGPVVAGDYDVVESSLPHEPSWLASVTKAVPA
jgi:hypothetical protein